MSKISPQVKPITKPTTKRSPKPAGKSIHPSVAKPGNKSSPKTALPNTPVTTAKTSARKNHTKQAPVSIQASRPVDPAPAISCKTELLKQLIRRREGASLTDLMKATGWQAHSVRGAISGVLRRKQGLAITLATGTDGTRVYRCGT